MAQCVVLMGISIEGVPADHMTSQIKQRFPLPVRQECFCQSQRRGVPSYVLPPPSEAIADGCWLAPGHVRGALLLSPATAQTRRGRS